MNSLIELAETYPLIFLALLGMGILGAVLIFVLALKITRFLLKLMMICLSLIALCVLGLIALATAEHVLAALQYQPPPPANVQPAADDGDVQP